MTKALAEPDEYNVDSERESNDFYAETSSWIALDRTLAHNTSELSRAACSVRRSAGNMPTILISDIQSLPDEIICDSGTEWLNWREFTRCSHSKRTCVCKGAKYAVTTDDAARYLADTDECSEFKWAFLHELGGYDTYEADFTIGCLVLCVLPDCT